MQLYGLLSLLSALPCPQVCSHYGYSSSYVCATLGQVRTALDRIRGARDQRRHAPTSAAEYTVRVWARHDASERPRLRSVAGARCSPLAWAPLCPDSTKRLTRLTRRGPVPLRPVPLRPVPLTWAVTALMCHCLSRTLRLLPLLPQRSLERSPLRHQLGHRTPTILIKGQLSPSLLMGPSICQM